MTFSCKYQNCDGKKHQGHGYCSTHYRQKFVKNQELRPIQKRVHLEGQECELEFCDKPAVSKNLCSSHYAQVFVYKLEPREIGKEICNAPWCDAEYKTGDGRKLCRKCSMRRATYDISIDEYINLKQSCEVCNGTYRMAIDHNHETGKFRGMLCSKCNTGLGMLNDDIELVREMLKYMEKNV